MNRFHMQPSRHNQRPCPTLLHVQRLLASLLLLAGIAVTTADAATASRWRHGWGLAETAAPARHSSSPAFARLILEPRAGGHAVIARNLLAGPLQVRLRGHTGTSAAQAAAPVVLQPGEQRALLWLPGDGSRQQLLLDAFPGVPAIRADDHVYQLPFRAAPVRVSQASGGHYSHTDAQNLHAVDFPLPEGTPVLAARAGKVMQAVDATADLGSLMRILHEDGSMAVYAHLQAGSLRLHTGQRVEAGQWLAASGNTGRSSGPHLHFAVQINTGLALASIPFRMGSARGELRFPRTTP